MDTFEKSTIEFCSQLRYIETEYRNGMALSAAVGMLYESSRQSCNECSRFEVKNGTDLEALRSLFRDNIHPCFSKSWFMNRALTKPRGYPGDYVILEGIYDQQPKTDDGIGRVLDEYFLRTELARAVTGRKNKCREKLEELILRETETELKILDIACGPCPELVEISGVIPARQ
jgi:extracellular factor (EF) 3-hydroxypalmitic acid methyl ester biosynthesis protein